MNLFKTILSVLFFLIVNCQFNLMLFPDQSLLKLSVYKLLSCSFVLSSPCFSITRFIQVMSVFTATTVANAPPICTITMKSKFIEFASTVMPYSIAKAKSNLQSSANEHSAQVIVQTLRVKWLVL